MLAAESIHFSGIPNGARQSLHRRQTLLSATSHLCWLSRMTALQAARMAAAQKVPASISPRAHGAAQKLYSTAFEMAPACPPPVGSTLAMLNIGTSTPRTAPSSMHMGASTHSPWPPGRRKHCRTAAIAACVNVNNVCSSDRYSNQSACQRCNSPHHNETTHHSGLKVRLGLRLASCSAASPVLQHMQLWDAITCYLLVMRWTHQSIAS